MPEQITQKRRNPFETPRAAAPQVVEQKVVETKPTEAVVVEEAIEEVVEPVVQVKKVAAKPHYQAPVVSDDREKYTATMETNLRRQIKIFCATRGVMFSEFIEEACLEKLAREGKR